MARLGCARRMWWRCVAMCRTRIGGADWAVRGIGWGTVAATGRAGTTAGVVRRRSGRIRRSDRGLEAVRTGRRVNSIGRHRVDDGIRDAALSDLWHFWNAGPRSRQVPIQAVTPREIDGRRVRSVECPADLVDTLGHGATLGQRPANEQAGDVEARFADAASRVVPGQLIPGQELLAGGDADVVDQGRILDDGQGRLTEAFPRVEVGERHCSGHGVDHTAENTGRQVGLELDDVRDRAADLIAEEFSQVLVGPFLELRHSVVERLLERFQQSTNGFHLALEVPQEGPNVLDDLFDDVERVPGENALDRVDDPIDRRYAIEQSAYRVLCVLHVVGERFQRRGDLSGLVGQVGDTVRKVSVCLRDLRSFGDLLGRYGRSGGADLLGERGESGSQVLPLSRGQTQHRRIPRWPGGGAEKTCHEEPRRRRRNDTEARAVPGVDRRRFLELAVHASRRAAPADGGNRVGVGVVVSARLKFDANSFESVCAAGQGVGELLREIAVFQGHREPGKIDAGGDTARQHGSERSHEHVQLLAK